MNPTIKLIVVATILILFFAGVSDFILERSPRDASNDFEGSWACTADAMECPDGSYVGRVPPYCQFAPCPR